LGCRQLRSVLAEYLDQYDRHRPHWPWGRQRRSGLANQLSPCRLGGVARRDRLGGLIHEYAQVA
jgi:putative transposase